LPPYIYMSCHPTSICLATLHLYVLPPYIYMSCHPTSICLATLYLYVMTHKMWRVILRSVIVGFVSGSNTYICIVLHLYSVIDLQPPAGYQGATCAKHIKGAHTHTLIIIYKYIYMYTYIHLDTYIHVAIGVELRADYQGAASAEHLKDTHTRTLINIHINTLIYIYIYTYIHFDTYPYGYRLGASSGLPRCHSR